MSTPFCSKLGLKSASVNRSARSKGMFFGTKPLNLSTPNRTANRSLRASSRNQLSEPVNFL